MTVFPPEPGSAHPSRVLLLHLCWKRTPGISGTEFLWARYPSCHPAVSV